jgi:hypothetical protein
VSIARRFPAAVDAGERIARSLLGLAQPLAGGG